MIVKAEVSHQSFTNELSNLVNFTELFMLTMQFDFPVVKVTCSSNTG